MAPIHILLLLGSCLTLAFLCSECALDIQQCGRVINDGDQARRECLNLTEEVVNPPPPIVLAAADENKQFLCKNELPLEAFSCTLFGFDLIWFFNDQEVTAFLPDDPIGDKVSISYPSSSPIYNLTAVLTQVTQVPELSRFNLPFCVSILIVQPFNESQTEVLPYNVTCQTHCSGDSSTEVCQTERYKVADEPTIPTDANGSIQYLVGLTEAIITLNWSPPENHDRTAIDYYELTLIGNADSSTTTIVYYVGADTQQSFSHKIVVSDKTYMAANITAVDVCGQRSEPSHFALATIVSESNISTFLNPAIWTVLACILSGIALLIIITGGD